MVYSWVVNLHYKFGKITNVVYAPTFLSLKMSLLLLYFRVFAPDKVTRYLIHFGIIFCFLAYTSLMFLDIFMDVIASITTNKALGAINLFSDIYILCVPIATVWKLQLSMKKMLGIVFIFMTGFM